MRVCTTANFNVIIKNSTDLNALRGIKEKAENYEGVDFPHFQMGESIEGNGVVEIGVPDGYKVRFKQACKDIGLRIKRAKGFTKIV